MRVVGILVICALGLPVSVHAQTLRLSQTLDTLELGKFPPPGTNDLIDKFRCGDYFLFQDDPPMVPKGPRIGFITLGEADKTIRDTWVLLKDKFRFVTSDQQGPPTVRFLSRYAALIRSVLRSHPQNISISPEMIDEVIIDLNKKDFDSSIACLTPTVKL